MTNPSGFNEQLAQKAGPDQANEIHRYDDLDTGFNAHHHTLGREPNQAASGEHIHNGKDSAILPGYSLVDHEHTVDGSLTIPTGTVVLWAGSQESTSVPQGWTICDGKALSRNGFPTLFGVIGTTYGAGDSLTTFNVPNLVQRFPRGATASNLGVTGGTDTHTHTTNIAAAPELTHSITESLVGEHNHANPSTGSAGGHAHSVGNTNSTGSHGHAYSGTTAQAGGGGFNPANPQEVLRTGPGHSHTYSGSTGSDGSHAHTVGGTDSEAAHAHSMGSTGSVSGHTHGVNAANHGAHNHTATGGSANTLPPFIYINYMIRTG